MSSAVEQGMCGGYAMRTEGATSNRWWALALVTLVALALAACGSGASSVDPAGGSSTGLVSPAGRSAPTATPYVAPTATPTIPTASLTLTCTVHTTEGSDDDETDQALSCSISHAPAGDTSFVLHYGVRDPSGATHSFTQTCSGALRNGVGTCTQEYDFILPFAPVPGAVSGQSSPSGKPLGPVLPSSV